MTNDAIAHPDSLKHPIKAVAIRTGLSTHVIRMWEKRYRAVSPDRTDTNRRLYSDEDIDRLHLLKQAVDGGHGIGQVANLSIDALNQLISINDRARPNPRSEERSGEDACAIYIDNAIQAAKDLDSLALLAVFGQAAVSFSLPVLIEGVISPFMHHMGDLWQKGALRISHEHLASSVTRAFLEKLNTTHSISASAPGIIVATPAGQLHELGATIVSTIATANGWHVTCLGPSLPAEEIAMTALQKQARAVALSVVYPADDPNLSRELMKLRALLPPGMPVLIGGCGTKNYSAVIREIGAVEVPNLAILQRELNHIRRR
jgi:MerR family transcriptional regulator, light-induced transcriptional regulator